VARLGAATLVCRVGRKSLVWGFIVAALLFAVGAAVLAGVLLLFLQTRSADFLLLLGGWVLLAWAGWAVWNKTCLLRHVRVGVHAGGISYCDGKGWVTCRWEQVADVRWKTWLLREESSGVAAGIPYYVTSQHVTDRIEVRRNDGVEIVFTHQLEDVASLGKALQMGFEDELRRKRDAGGSQAVTPDR
jgi:hypothetical protein